MALQNLKYVLGTGEEEINTVLLLNFEETLSSDHSTTLFWGRLFMKFGVALPPTYFLNRIFGSSLGQFEASHQAVLMYE